MTLAPISLAPVGYGHGGNRWHSGVRLPQNTLLSILIGDEEVTTVLVSRKQVGAAIVEARAKAGLTPAELGERSGLDEATIAAIEEGQYKPASHELGRLAEALGVDELDLLKRPSPGYLLL
jgi:DNA-binding XRE family transcriptional regulator